jgi:hypothetical protein
LSISVELEFKFSSPFSIFQKFFNKFFRISGFRESTFLDAILPRSLLDLNAEHKKINQQRFLILISLKEIAYLNLSSDKHNICTCEKNAVRLKRD